MTSDTIGCLTLDRRAMAWLMLTISSREKCLSTPAEISSPMLSMRIAACSDELSERFCARMRISLAVEALRPSGWVEVSFIAPYPLLDDFRDSLGIVLGQHLQVLDLHFQARARRRQTDFRQRAQLTEHGDARGLLADPRQQALGSTFAVQGQRLVRRRRRQRR